MNAHNGGLLLAFSSAYTLFGWSVFGSRGYEQAWRVATILPQYRYISRPVYKFCISKTNAVFATAASFFVTEIIMHQFLIDGAKCLYDRKFCKITWDPWLSAAWMTLGIPVMWAKSHNHRI